MNRSTPGLPVHHQLPEFTETHVHRVSDVSQPRSEERRVGKEPKELPNEQVMPPPSLVTDEGGNLPWRTQSI